MSKFGYTSGMCPESEKACREVVNLPTHSKISEKEMNRVLTFLAKYGISS
jgi:dTDP-4-amino-4,6-dideoxygalactose transaminase